jgi:formamidopyrimidine-DNA glycosylase
MPELPEVEVTRRGLLADLPGRTVVHISWSGHRLRTAIPRRLLQEHILGREILTIDRRAKYLLLRMVGGAVLVIHLGMTGKLALVGRDTAPHKHDHLVLSLDSVRDLRLNDSRRFGALIVWPAAYAEGYEREFSAKEGIEPFGLEFNAEHLLDLAGKRKTPVKSLLMNARLVAGIGNIYANEILFAARIHPLTPASRLVGEEWQGIITAGRRILQQAIDAGGSTIADFLGASGHPGYFQLQFKVYGRKDCPCTHCSQPIVKTTLAGRATYFCPTCQTLPNRCRS